MFFTLLLTKATLAQTYITHPEDKQPPAEEVALQWFTNFDEAKKEAKKSNRPILMYFNGSDWCAPCRVLKKDILDTDRFIALSERFVLLMVDIPHRVDIVSPEILAHNKRLRKKYNKEDVFPAMLALNARGKVLDRIDSYSFMMHETSYHYAFFDRVLARY